MLILLKKNPTDLFDFYLTYFRRAKRAIKDFS